MNSVTAPSFAPASRMNFPTSPVRSTKPAPEVSTAIREVTMLPATTAVGWERDIDLDLVTGTLPPRRPRESRAHNHRLQFCERIVHRRIPDEGSRGMDPAFAATTIDQGPSSNLPRNVLLHAVGYFDQPPPGALHERHQAVHVLVARQRNLQLALALGCLRLSRLGLRRFGLSRIWRGLSIRLRQRLAGLAFHRAVTGGELRLQLFVLR